MTKMSDISLWIERCASFYPGRTAIRFRGQTLSYADLAQGIERAAAMLSGELGLKHGDRIAWLGLNHPDMLGLLFAAARCGLILVPLNWRLAPPEHAFILRDAGARVLVAQAGLAAAPRCRGLGLREGPAGAGGARDGGVRGRRGAPVAGAQDRPAPGRRERTAHHGA